MVDKLGFSRGNLIYLVEKGLLEKTARGVYTLMDTVEDEFFILQNRFRRGIFSHETALFLLNLAEQVPLEFSMTFPSTYNITNAKEVGVSCTQCKAQWYLLGVQTIKSPYGNPLILYDRERTLCDLLRKSDAKVVASAFKRYLRRKDKNKFRLLTYARMLGIEKKVKNYLEVFL